MGFSDMGVPESCRTHAIPQEFLKEENIFTKIYSVLLNTFCCRISHHSLNTGSPGGSMVPCVPFLPLVPFGPRLPRGPWTTFGPGGPGRQTLPGAMQNDFAINEFTSSRPSKSVTTVRF